MSWSSKLESCQCVGVKRPQAMCAGPLMLDNRGVKARWTPKSGQDVSLYIVDGCLTTSGRRCDALFSVRGKDAGVMLIELKGTHAQEGFEQLASTFKSAEYKEFIADTFGAARVRQRAMLVSRVVVTQFERDRFYRDHGLHLMTATTLGPSGLAIDVQGFWSASR